MQKNEQYDQRQYKRLLHCLDLFADRKISLRSLINDVEAIIFSLESISEKTRNDLLSEWGVLEEIYAVALDRGRQNLEKEEIEEIDKAVLDIWKLVEAQQRDNH